MGRASLQVVQACVLVALGACAMTAPSYTPSLENTNRLVRAGLGPTRVGPFSAQAPARNDSISVRGKMMTPAQGTYAAYLADALRQELLLARTPDTGARTEISGVLAKNDLDASGSGMIEARFLVRQDGQVRYDRVKATRHQWETRYLDSIPRAQQEYAVLVRNLITELFSDPDFIAALKVLEKTE